MIIFEDDFDFLVDYNTFNNSVLEFFSFNFDFKVVMLSYSCVDTPNKVNDLISTTTNSSNAAGYLVNSSAYDELIYWLSYGSEMLEKTREHWNYINDQIWKKCKVITSCLFLTKDSENNVIHIVTYLKNSKLFLKYP